MISQFYSIKKGLMTASLLLVWFPFQLFAASMNQHDTRALAADPRLAPGQLAPVLEGLGDHHHPVTTSSERAQLFFDQGLKLTYGFNHQEALRSFKEAARLEDSLIYNEPPDWYYPVRHTLGAVLLEAGYPKEAEVVYWQDLRRYRDNGYSLFGLWQSLKAQNRLAEARQAEANFQQAWTLADFKLSSSRF